MEVVFSQRRHLCSEIFLMFRKVVVFCSARSSLPWDFYLTWEVDNALGDYLCSDVFCKIWNLPFWCVCSLRMSLLHAFKMTLIRKIVLALWIRQWRTWCIDMVWDSQTLIFLSSGMLVVWVSLMVLSSGGMVSMASTDQMVVLQKRSSSPLKGVPPWWPGRPHPRGPGCALPACSCREETARESDEDSGRWVYIISYIL